MKQEEKYRRVMRKYDSKFLDKVIPKVMEIHFRMNEEKVMNTKKFEGLIGELIDLILEVEEKNEKSKEAIE